MDDIEAVPVDGVDPGMPLVRGDVDAAVVTGPQARLAQGVEPGLVLVRAAGERPGLVSRVLVARDAVADERPGQMLAVVRAWQDVYLLDRDDPERIGARVGTIQGGDAEDALAALEGTSIYDVPQNAVELFPGGEYHDTVAGLVAGLATEAGWIAPSDDPAALIDGVFAQTVATAS
jgi:NitT/TauT family transport system substrate-binding protein